VDPERFKRQSPESTRDSPVVKCKRLWTESLEKETGPIGRFNQCNAFFFQLVRTKVDVTYLFR